MPKQRRERKERDGKLAEDVCFYLVRVATYFFVLAVGLFLPKIRGFFGEKSVAFFLSRLDPAKYKVLHNVMLPAGSKTTQIDHIVVSNYGIFVIETKNYGGWITLYFHRGFYHQGRLKS
ncbi:MAG: hypothetical protein PWQ91_1383 [Eubacteriales bacterium]|nr:hypothetical protein [Eubacteriales bacterium]